MKKVIILLILLMPLGFVSAGFFDGFKFPDLSPYLPDFSPFNVSVSIQSNTAPSILNLNSNIYVCEDKSLNYFFNVSDFESNLDRVEISPASKFFVQIISFPGVGQTIYGARIFSAVMSKADVGIYQRSIAAIDIENERDVRPVQINVIEINHAPAVASVGVRTVHAQGNDSSFYHQVIASDIEDGNQNSGNLIFNLTFLNSAKLFNISQNGIMNFTPSVHLNLSNVVLPTTYNMRLCVKDKGIGFIHPNIAICNQDGLPIETCQQFSITVLEGNRAPNITYFNYTIIPFEGDFEYLSSTDYHGNNFQYLSFSGNFTGDVKGLDTIFFNISAYDPDGTVPEVYWYVNNVSVKYDLAKNSSEFNYTFGEDIGGNHTISVVVTDGLLNDSLSDGGVKFTVRKVRLRSSSPPPSGSGGSFTRINCEETWGCNDWNVCQDIGLSAETGILPEEDSKTIQDNCRLDFFKDNCGFQLRDCFDVNSCNSSGKKPELIEHCYYVENPSCSDGVKNCHNNGCEILIDCGGPCDACPTCSDGIKNQREQGVDCGSPCPNACPPPLPFFERKIVQYSLFGIVGSLIVVVAFQLIRISLARREIEEH